MSIVQSNFTPVETNITDTVQFSVTNNAAHLFSMLSDILYSNKELAVVHEISANAIDAHRMVGKKDVPIRVVCPTQLVPELTIRDYGPGLADEEIKVLITTYGESGKYKRESNDYFGCWGVGAKSPAAVTRTWTIESHHNNEKRIYVVFIASDGVPQLTTIPKVDYTDETGILVRIPVNPSRIPVWKEVLESAYTYYETKPETVGFVVRDITKSNTTISGNNWAFIKAHRYEGSQILAIVSYRKYHLNLDTLRRDVTNEKAKKLLTINSMYGISIQLEFLTGEVSLDMSRENIQYTPQTVAIISAKLAKVFDDLRAIAMKISDNASSPIKYRRALIDWYSIKLVGISEGIQTALLEGNKWGVTTAAELKFIPVFGDDTRVGAADVSIRRPHNQTFYKLIVGAHRQGVMHSKIKDDTCVLLVPWQTKAFFVILVEDVRGTRTHYKSEYHATKDKTIISISPQMEKEINPELKNLVVYGSKYKVAGKKTAKVSTDQNTAYYRMGRRFIPATTVSPNCVWAFFSNRTTTDSLVNVTTRHVEYAASNDKEVRFMKVGGKLPTGAVKLRDWLESEFAKFTPEVISALQEKRYTNEICLIYRLYTKALALTKVNMSSIKHSQGEFYKTLEILETVRKLNSLYNIDLNNYFTLREMLGLQLVPVPHSTILKDQTAKLFDTYPLLRYYEPGRRCYTEDEVIDYVNLVDSFHYKELK